MAKNKHHAFMSLEMIFTIALVLGVLTLFVAGLTLYTQHNDVMLARQRAVMAAEATLSEIRVGLEPDPEAFVERFSGFTLDVQRTAGQGPWSGCVKVDVSVGTVAGAGTPIHVRLAGYACETDS